MLPSFCQTAIAIERAPLTVQRGTKVRDWTRATTHTVPGCSVQPGGTDGTWGETRNGATVRATLYAPPNADIAFGDKVVVAGRVYAIDGEPQPWTSPTGRIDHVVCALVDWRG